MNMKSVSASSALLGLTLALSPAFAHAATDDDKKFFSDGSAI